MALIKCSNCNHEISDTIKKCIHCGAKIQKNSSIVNERQYTKKKKDVKKVEIVKVNTKPIKPLKKIIPRNKTIEKKQQINEQKERNYKPLIIGIVSFLLIVGISILSITTYNWLKGLNSIKLKENMQTSTNDKNNNNNYSTQNETKKLTLLTIDNCIHCDNLKPVVEEISSEYGFNLEIKNYKENELDNKYKGIEFLGYPTLFLFDNENYITHFEGYKPKEELIAFLKEKGFIKE